MNSKSPGKYAILAVVIIAAVAVLYAKQSQSPGGKALAQQSEVAQGAGTPRLLDLGSVSCVPCKMMQPILDDLEKEYAGRLKVEFVDVWQDRAVGEKHGIEAIPTQIFFDASGKEFFRHTGFYSKEDILKAFHDNGISLEAK
jgi:thioredoxin 1